MPEHTYFIMSQTNALDQVHPRLMPPTHIHRFHYALKGETITLEFDFKSVRVSTGLRKMK